MQNIQAKTGLRRLLILQLAILGIMVLLWYNLAEGTAAYSALLGGLVYIIPAWCFAAKLFQHGGARAANKIVRAFYVGEALKLMLTAVLFALVLIFIRISALAFFSAYIIMQLAFWLAPLVFKL